jgi:hypothetical protein
VSLHLSILCLVQLNQEVEHRHYLVEKRPILPDFR